jgi:hypothetical protein
VNAIQIARAVGGYPLPVDPVRLAGEHIFEVRHQLRGVLDAGFPLDDEQIAAAETAVELVRAGAYPGTGTCGREAA